MEPSDEALVLACRSGDPAAWEALIERYQRLIYSIARRAGLDEERSADVFQRVFATLVERLHEIKQPALIGAWLATTARHEAWRYSRRERMERVASLDTPAYAEIAATLGMSEGSIGPTRARCLKKLRRILDNLDF